MSFIPTLLRILKSLEDKGQLESLLNLVVRHLDFSNQALEISQKRTLVVQIFIGLINSQEIPERELIEVRAVMLKDAISVVDKIFKEINFEKKGNKKIRLDKETVKSLVDALKKDNKKEARS